MIKAALHHLIAGLNAVNLYLILPLLATIILADITLRFVVNSPIVWAHEVCGLLLICLFFLAIPTCIQSKQLLEVDIVYQLMGKKQKRFVTRLNHLLLLGFSILLICQGYLGMKDSLEYESRAFTLNIMYWPFYGLMTFVGMVCAVQAILAFFTSPEHDSSDSEALRSNNNKVTELL